MANLLDETRVAIKDSGHTPEDVVFIGSTPPTPGDPAYECTWREFELLADFDYDQGFGAARIATDLRVVFSDGSDMHRGEYDGSEWREYSRPFARPAATRPIRSLGGDGYLWATLAEIDRGPERAWTR